MFWLTGFLFSDDGEIFQVKKTSHSRRLMKQLKADKKKDKAAEGGTADKGKNGAADELEADRATTTASNHQASEYRAKTARANQMDPELDITFKDNIPKPPRPDQWTLTGKEAEALHMEEEDQGRSNEDDSSDGDTSDPLQKLLKSGWLVCTIFYFYLSLSKVDHISVQGRV